MSIQGDCDKMTTKEKGRKYDGVSRPTNDIYSKRWQELDKDEQDYLDSLKDKL